MGTWSTAIDGNDTFLDIYTNFFNLYNQGYNPVMASKGILKDYEELFDEADSGEYHNALFALALAQWETKSQDPVILDKVKNIIEVGKDVDVWKEFDATPVQLEQRKQVLSTFLATLLVPKDKAKRRVKPKFDFATIELINIISPDQKKRFTVKEEFTNGEYIHTSALMMWANGGGSVLYYQGQGKAISARWIDSGTLEVTHVKEIKFTKKDEQSYFCGDAVKVIYCQS
jgi:hypothetical protein